MPNHSGPGLGIEVFAMSAVFGYLIASSWFFLLSWIVLLLVAYSVAFPADSA